MKATTLIETKACVCFLLITSFDKVHSFSHHIRVCQNKDCVKKCPSTLDGGLMQMFDDLIPPQETDVIEIESTGCLSHCASGPNVSITTKDKKERVFNGVEDLQTAAAILDVGAGVDSPIALMVAVDTMAQVNRTPNHSKKIELLNKVVSSLEKAELSSSNAMSHALLLRADAYLDFSLNDQSKALEDSSRAAEINHLHGRAYRAMADAHEASGNVLEAMEAIQKWADVNPSFISKAKNELSRLSLKCNP